MKRRFYVVHVRPEVPRARVLEAMEKLRASSEFIPQLSDCHAAFHLGGSERIVVWDHCYDDEATYEGYRENPYHGTVIDRYLLHDSPETIRALGTFACGYDVTGPVAETSAPVRRVVLFEIREGAPRTGLDALADALVELPDRVGGMTSSVFAPITVGRGHASQPFPWTHLWDQGFDSVAAVDAYRSGETEVAAAERSAWRGSAADSILRSETLVYETRAPVSG